MKWQIFLASKFGRLFLRVNLEGCHGKIFWQVILAHLFVGSFWRIYLAGHFGAFIWQVIWAHLFGGFSWSMKQASFKQRKEKKRNVQSVDL
jgi:hypothetical protein